MYRSTIPGPEEDTSWSVQRDPLWEMPWCSGKNPKANSQGKFLSKVLKLVCPENINFIITHCWCFIKCILFQKVAHEVCEDYGYGFHDRSDTVENED